MMLARFGFGPAPTSDRSPANWPSTAAALMASIYCGSPRPLASIRCLVLFKDGGEETLRPARTAMLSYPKSADVLDGLAEKLRLAPAATADLFAHVVACACARVPVLRKSGKGGPYDR